MAFSKHLFGSNATRTAPGLQQMKVPKWWLFALIGIAIGLRLAYVIITGKTNLSWGDEFTYDALGQSLAKGYGFAFVRGEPSMLRAPLYPMLLAVIYALVGHSYMVVLGVQVLVGGITAYFLFLVALRLYRDVAPAIVAACLFVIHPVLIFSTALLYSETFYLLLMLCFTLACLKMTGPSQRKWWAVISGLLLGASVLMKPNMLLFPAALILWLWFVLRDLRQSLVLGGLVALAMVAVVLPWTIRNYQISGALVPVSANSGLNLWQGNHPEANGAAFPLSQVDPLEGHSEVERDLIYRQWAIEEIRSDPGRFLALIPRKIGMFFAPLETSNRGRLPLRMAALMTWAWVAFLGLAAWGFVRTLGRTRDWVLMYLMIIYPVGLAAVFYGATRYGMVTYPYLFMLAADPLVWLGRRFRVLLSTQEAVQIPDNA